MFRLSKGLFFKGLSCFTSPGILEVNFRATWIGFLRPLTEDRNLRISGWERGPCVKGRVSSIGRSSSV